MTNVAEEKLRTLLPSLDAKVRTYRENGMWAAELEVAMPHRTQHAWKNYGGSETEAVDRVFNNAYFHYVERPDLARKVL